MPRTCSTLKAVRSLIRLTVSGSGRHHHCDCRRGSLIPKVWRATALTETRNRVASRSSQESMASSTAGVTRIGRHAFEPESGSNGESITLDDFDLDFDMTALGG